MSAKTSRTVTVDETVHMETIKMDSSNMDETVRMEIIMYRDITMGEMVHMEKIRMYSPVEIARIQQ